MQLHSCLCERYLDDGGGRLYNDFLAHYTGCQKKPNSNSFLWGRLQDSGCQQVWKPLVAPTAGRQKRIVFWKDIFLTPCICYGPETGKLHIAFINIFQNINISKSANASTNIFQNIKKCYIAKYTIGFSKSLLDILHGLPLEHEISNKDIIDRARNLDLRKKWHYR